MKLPTRRHRLKLEKVCDKTKARPALSQPWLDVDADGAGRLVATDSYVLLIQPVELDPGDQPGAVPLAAVKDGGSVAAGARCEVDGGNVSYLRPDGFKFPDYRDLIGDPEKWAGGFRVSLNAGFLKNLAAAMGTDAVVLTFQADGGVPVPLRPAIVTSAESDAVGLIMPIRISGDYDALGKVRALLPKPKPKSKRRKKAA